VYSCDNSNRWTFTIKHDLCYYHMSTPGTIITWVHPVLLSHEYTCYYYHMSTPGTIITWVHPVLLSHEYTRFSCSVRVSQSLVFCVLICTSLFLLFLFGYCGVCTSSTYGFWLPPLILQNGFIFPQNFKQYRDIFIKKRFTKKPNIFYLKIWL
jgi:hypothetical protein